MKGSTTGQPCRTRLWLMAAVLLSVPVACTQPGDPVQPRADRPTAEASLDPAIDLRYTPPSLTDALVIERARSKRVGGLKRVDIRLRNVRSSTVNLEYRPLWEDEAGFAVGEPDVWQPLEIESGENRRIELGAPSPRGARVIVQVRRAD